MKKSVKKQNASNVWRYIALLPAICAVWVVVFFVGAYIESFFYTHGLWVRSGMFFIIVDFFILPGSAIFFTTRWIAPKYKNITAIIATILCVLWGILLLYGLAHPY
ncbi:MAG: hypothetical protein J5714_04800 [Alphaproteobacteria bacterium]|nr:hypothetical protein [Alphaproteobacteria bacterium]